MRAETVKTLARQCGFELVGIARAEPLPEFSYYREWVAAGAICDQEVTKLVGSGTEAVFLWLPRARRAWPRGFPATLRGRQHGSWCPLARTAGRAIDLRRLKVAATIERAQGLTVLRKLFPLPSSPARGAAT